MDKSQFPQDLFSFSNAEKNINNQNNETGDLNLDSETETFEDTNDLDFGTETETSEDTNDLDFVAEAETFEDTNDLDFVAETETSEDTNDLDFGTETENSENTNDLDFGPEAETFEDTNDLDFVAEAETSEDTNDLDFGTEAETSEDTNDLDFRTEAETSEDTNDLDLNARTVPIEDSNNLDFSSQSTDTTNNIKPQVSNTNNFSSNHSELPSNSSIDFDLPKNISSVIKVIGVGGGGSNAVNYMIKEGIKGVDFIICNTDAQALEKGQAPTKLQLGMSITEGLGAGENPSIGEQAALESEQEIQSILQKNTKMVFITAGMGGGTGTGAAPIIARICKEMEILTIGIVTVPFDFEGPKRLKQAKDGIEKIREYVDSLVVINNNKLVEVYGDLGLKSGFAKADATLMVAARGISEVITQNCLVNIDLNDAKTVLKDSGTAIMGSGRASGPNRAQEVVRKALDSPLLNDNHIKGANKILLLIISGNDEITIKEIDEINHYLQREAGGNADIILGVGDDVNLGDEIGITIIATGVLGHDVNPSTGLEEKTILYLDQEDQHNNLSTKAKENEELLTACLSNSNDNNCSDEFIQNEPVVSKETTPTKHKSVLADNITNDDTSELSDENIKRAELRKKRLQKFHNMNFKNQIILKELEDEPAYKRKGIELDEVQHSSIESNSRLFLDKEEKITDIKNSNSYLHDNVD